MTDKKDKEYWVPLTKEELLTLKLSLGCHLLEQESNLSEDPLYQKIINRLEEE